MASLLKFVPFYITFFCPMLKSELDVKNMFIIVFVFFWCTFTAGFYCFVNLTFIYTD